MSSSTPTDDERSTSSVDLGALSAAGADARRGSASVVALALGAGAVGVTEALESVPVLQGFEEAVGLAVSAYYANKLGGAFVTASGRETFRLRLVENFTRVTGRASAPLAIAGALAKTDKELDAQISGAIDHLLASASASGDARDAPEEVRRAVARFIRERDGETRAEIDALRVANDAMRAEVDAIEMLQTDLMDARRETSEARANVKVMNLEDKERARLEAEARNARAEGAAFADAMRAEMASMAADAATAAVEAEKALREERLRKEAERRKPARRRRERRRRRRRRRRRADDPAGAALAAKRAAAAERPFLRLGANRRAEAPLAESAEWTGSSRASEQQGEELRSALEAAERRRAAKSPPRFAIRAT